MTTKVERCWNVIGIEGDRTCSQLSTYAHCRNCPVYSAAGRYLLERPTPEKYRHEWTQLLAESSSEKNSHLPTYAVRTTETLTVVIFRLQREWLALPAQVLKETTPPSVIHTLPHRHNQVLRGLINIRGELLLCVSLSHLLNIESSDDTPLQGLSPVVHSGMVVIEKAGNAWVFPVDEIYGVHRFHSRELRDALRKMTQSTQTYTKGLFSWQPANHHISHTVSYLDDELLFTTLARKAQ
ncbi:chemotaxis protein CheW [Nostoc sp. LEGE 06077]|uniref:chemotaxis protein CheW n=1 Tax=Nostoc sp. LEGE 06077 TaxID=915325 RepID=UPI00187FECF7|nr:chemotaxis protein CheW [Nostoc sp. LEGE 06077]MBE9208292.1 chemotaxis protein CheW [Nostoc sp. LEGE 06077]